MHPTHATTNLCNSLRQVTHDIWLHTTLHIQHVYMVLIYMFIHTYQSKCSCTLCAPFFAIIVQLIKVWHVFKNWMAYFWTCVTFKLFFCFHNKKFIGLISIVKNFTIKMMTSGTPWNVHWPFDMCPFLRL